MALRDLRLLTAILAVMIVIDALLNPAVLLWAAVLPDAFLSLVTPVASTVDGGVLVFKIATMIVFSYWIYVAGQNLVEADIEDLDFTPASRIWWFAVPIASFFKPFQGMRELWNASRGTLPYDTNDSLVATWWALWLGTRLFGSFSGLLGARGTTNMLWATSAANIALAVVAIMLIRGIAQGQRTLDGSSLSEVFA
jgi:hypothetical protein